MKRDPFEDDWTDVEITPASLASGLVLIALFAMILPWIIRGGDWLADLYAAYFTNIV